MNDNEIILTALLISMVVLITIITIDGQGKVNYTNVSLVQNNYYDVNNTCISGSGNIALQDIEQSKIDLNRLKS